LRKTFVGEVLFRAIHCSRFHLLELDLCDWLLKAPLLASLFRLPALATLQSFRHRFTRPEGEFPDERQTYKDDAASIQQQLSFEWCIGATQAHSLSLPHLTELQLEHPWMTVAELVALLLGMPSLADLRLDCPRTPDIGRVSDSGSAALARTLRILQTAASHLDPG
jgi:hypothetical protein